MAFSSPDRWHLTAAQPTPADRLQQARGLNRRQFWIARLAQLSADFEQSAHGQVFVRAATTLVATAAIQGRLGRRAAGPAVAFAE
jgi:hypothetical protein